MNDNQNCIKLQISMNKIFKNYRQQHFIRALLALVIFISISCASDPEEEIANKWEMVRINQEENPTNQSATWEFREDGVVEINGGPGKVMFAKYAFEDSAQYIMMSPIDGGFPSRFKIEKLTSDEMILIVSEMFKRDTIYFER